MKQRKQDPLYTIFEQHLFNFQDPNADRETFILTVVKDYLTQIRKLGLSVPEQLLEQISEELCLQVNTMLVKKIYGCMNINQYTAKAPTEAKKRAKTHYKQLTTEASREEKRRVNKKAA